MQAFMELRAQAEATWQEFTDSSQLRIRVGMGSCGITIGGGRTRAAIEAQLARLGIPAQVGIVGCIGMCWAEPLLEVAKPGEPGILYGPVPADAVPQFLEDLLVRGQRRPDLALGVHGEGPLDGIPSLFSLEFFQVQERRLLRRCGIIDPDNIDHYIATGGYTALDKVLSGMTPEQVIQEVSDSVLAGRGGAFFPTGRKWGFLRAAQRTPKYILCNADEGDPGSFVNRILLDSDPHATIEGMIIGGFATGASQGYIYVREEYPYAVERLRHAVRQARERGLLGSGILGSDVGFDIEVVRGAGSYLCGEETGLIASLQDGRGMPRIKPPFPAEAGLFNQPSNVNNVESYANAPDIIAHGAQWWASVGSERAKGTKLFCLSGDIQRVCIVEVPMGTSLKAVMEQAGGGVPGGRALKAVQPGGPLGGFLRADQIDIPLEVEPFRALGIIMGSGGLVFLDERVCILDIVRELVTFNQDESCGRCTTCRIGTMRMVGILERITTAQGQQEDITHLQRLPVLMLNGNCFHSQLAPTPVSSSLRAFPEEWEAHVRERRCPAGVCSGMSQMLAAVP